jgi:hypothetical protein
MLGFKQNIMQGIKHHAMNTKFRIRTITKCIVSNQIPCHVRNRTKSESENEQKDMSGIK